MTAAPLSLPTTTPPQRAAASARRIAAIARFELLLLARNKVMLFNALLITPGMVVFMLWVLPARPDAAALVAQMVLWATAFVVYYNLTSIFVTRREERVFARMETGEASKWEALAAAATPSVLIAVVQVVAAGVVGKIWLGGAVAAHPWQAGAGFVLVVVAFVALAGATTAFTKSVEAAQLTTMPILFAMLLTSGLLIPMSYQPHGLQVALAYTPLAALADLIMSSAADLRAVPALLVLAAWAALSVWLARRFTAFAPRR